MRNGPRGFVAKRKCSRRQTIRTSRHCAVLKGTTEPTTSSWSSSAPSKRQTGRQKKLTGTRAFDGEMVSDVLAACAEKHVTRLLVTGFSLQTSQVSSDGHRPQVGRGAGRDNRAIARIGPRHRLASAASSLRIRAGGSESNPKRQRGMPLDGSFVLTHALTLRVGTETQ